MSSFLDDLTKDLKLDKLGDKKRNEMRVRITIAFRDYLLSNLTIDLDEGQKKRLIEKIENGAQLDQILDFVNQEFEDFDEYIHQIMRDFKKELVNGLNKK